MDVVKIKPTSPVNNSKAKNIRNLKKPNLYINRELSWLQFNLRVLEEARDERNPLLERVKFLAIFANNLDEFFMIRVSGLQKQAEAGTLRPPIDGMEPAEQLIKIRQELLWQLELQTKCWQNDLVPKLKKTGIRIKNYRELKSCQKKFLRQYFEQEIFPTLTPLGIDPGHPFPHISNLSINLAVVIHDPERGEKFARLKVPDMIPRLLIIPADEKSTGFPDSKFTDSRSVDFILIEDVIAANLDLLFPSLKVTAAYPFRITRDADIEIEEDEAADLLSCIQEHIGMRRFGFAVRLEVDKKMPNSIRDLLMNNLHLTVDHVYALDKPIGISSLMELYKVERTDLKDPPFLPSVPPSLAKGENIFSFIRRQNFILYHPYDSFSPVVDFLTQAARDPKVLAIKQTLYRVGINSPIVDALMEARDNGKQVAVLLEIKARFDEENNIGWAQALEKAGVHVVYGLVGLKTHSKLCLVVRKEGDIIRRYVHLGTGNYNAVTSRIYTDLSFFTCDPEIGADASDLFNSLTGYSRKTDYHKIWVAPHNLRQKIIALIEREILAHQKFGDGYLAFKMNALVDEECIQALYRASQAGVKIDLQVRGICCLRPGIPGLSENITVTSIVGRFLEHTRIYYFKNGGDDDLLLGSADLMPRNLDRRVEILFPIEDPGIKKIIFRDILTIHLQDNQKSSILYPDGHYERIKPDPGNKGFNSQAWMLDHRGLCFMNEPTANDQIYPMTAATLEEELLEDKSQ